MASNKPNILWICTDQQRYDTLGCTGNEWVRTPNIDKLAAGGVLFENAYCQNPVCSPSRASFLTGRYPRTARGRQNGQNIPADERLISKVLSENGYGCGLSGKLHLSVCGPKATHFMEPRIDDGYAVFHWSHHPGEGWPTNEYRMWLNEQGVPYATPKREDCKYVCEGMPVKYHQTTWCADKAINFIECVGETKYPWMFSVNMFDPHHPFDPPKEYLERYLDKLDDIPLPNYVPGELDRKPVFQRKDHVGAYDTPGNLAYDKMSERDHRMLKAAYWAMVDLIDEQVGRMIECLERTGQLDNTIVIFHSDHGELLGDHGVYLKGPHFYEPSVHVPLIISWPGKIGAGRRSEAMVELVDLAPTLLEAAEIEPEIGMQGKSLWPLLSGAAPLNEHREDVYCEYYNSNIKHTDPRAYVTMVCDGRYKLAKVHGDPKEVLVTGEFYDLQADPNETTNLWEKAEYRDVKLRLLERLCDRMAWTVDPLPIRLSWW
jgi:choline-sulfatase